MSILLELPPEVEERLHRDAKVRGVSVETLAIDAIAGQFPPVLIRDFNELRMIDEQFLDHECHAECELDGDTDITLEEVRSILSKIPGNMTQDFIDERDE